MTKKLLVPVLLALVLAACAPAVAPTVAAPAVVDPLAGKTFYWLGDNISHPFYVIGLKGWNEAAKELGVKTQFVGPLVTDPAGQFKTLEELVANPNTAGILWYPENFTAGEPLIEEAQAKGIPVVIANSDSPFKTRVGFIGTDHGQMGRSAAAVAAKLINCKGSVGSIGNNSAPVLVRLQAFGDQMKVLCPNVKIEESAPYEGSALGAVATVDAYMVAHPDLTLLYFADGAASSTIAPWRERIQAGCKTLFLGSDMPDEALQAVKDGTWVATMGQDTYAEEYWGLTFLVNAALGKSIPDTTFVAAMIVDKTNVDKFLAK
jgi:ribose transport system substrate-binding protein